jgi:hypothetical protein
VHSLEAGLVRAERALAVFLATVDTPVLKRSQRTIESDIWIRWMSLSESNARAQGAIGEREREVGVWGALEGEGGWNWDPQAAAKQHVERLSELGRVGVVVVPPYSRDRQLPGAIHMRADAYQVVGRQQPPATGAPEYARIPWQAQQFFRSGEVVTLEDTVPDTHHRDATIRSTGGFVAKRLGQSLPVDAREREAAFAFLDIPASYYPRPGSTAMGSEGYELAPERAYPFTGAVHDALRTVRDSLVARESEDGVLVTEADGTGLVLFTPYLSFGDAKAAGARTGARRVVAVDLDPNSTMQGWAADDVVVTKAHDGASFAAQIMGVRALLGRGPKITVQ